jgi:hypothetical protein
VGFSPTEDNSARVLFDADAWTVEEAEEQWRLVVVEQELVSFGVRKAPEQTIALGGPSGAWVSQVPEGDTAEGSAAGAEFALFRVDTAQILDGGERTFTLTVTEPGKESRTVRVILEVEADLTQGVGVFFVGEEGRPVRITPENAETYANEAYVQDREAGFERTISGAGQWRIDFAEVDSLFDALIWVDQYAKGGTAEKFQEYRIRVEKDEAIIPVTLSCGGASGGSINRADYVRFTVWGYKQERTLILDTLIRQNEGVMGSEYGLGTTKRVLIDVGGNASKHIALSLGANITINAQKELYPNLPGTDGGWKDEILQIEPGSMATLERGAKLTNHQGIAVWVPNDPNKQKSGVFEMRGGAITNCGVAISMVYAGENSDILGYPTRSFRFHSGTISGNGEDNFILCSRPSSRFPYAYFAVNE